MTILIVDDHPLFRNGLRQLLEQQPDVGCVEDVPTGAAAVQRATELRPELMIVDIHLPDMSGIEVTRRVKDAGAVDKIVILSADADRTLVDGALQAGACGYVLKKSIVDDVLQAVRFVMAGRLYLSPEASDGIVQDYRAQMAGEVAKKLVLTERDRRLLRFIAEGKRNKEIAADLRLSESSVETYRARLMRKLQCSSTAELIRYAFREGIAAL